MTSEMMMAGVPLKVVADRLGHASITITADIYTRVSGHADREAAETLARILSG
jgi:integrase